MFKVDGVKIKGAMTKWPVQKETILAQYGISFFYL